DISAGDFDFVLILAPKQHAESLFYMGAGLMALKLGGMMICAAANDAGGKRLRKDMAALGLDAAEASRNKARAVWARKTERADTAHAAEWIAAGGRQSVCGGAFVSQPGIFGWDAVDKGSALLAGNLPSL